MGDTSHERVGMDLFEGVYFLALFVSSSVLQSVGLAYRVSFSFIFCILSRSISRERLLVSFPHFLLLSVVGAFSRGLFSIPVLLLFLKQRPA